MEGPGLPREPNPGGCARDLSALAGSLDNRLHLVVIEGAQRGRSALGWLQLLGEPLPQSRARNRGSARDLVGVDVTRLAPPFEPALHGRQGDSEELSDLLSRDPAVDGGEHFQS